MQWSLHTQSATSAKDLRAALEKTRDLYLAGSGILDLDLRKSLQAQMDAGIAGACATAGSAGQVQASLSGSVSATDVDVSSRLAVAVDFLANPLAGSSEVVEPLPVSAKPKK
jgi:hypothetical protein